MTTAQNLDRYVWKRRHHRMFTMKLIEHGKYGGPPVSVNGASRPSSASGYCFRCMGRFTVGTQITRLEYPQGPGGWGHAAMPDGYGGMSYACVDPHDLLVSLMEKSDPIIPVNVNESRGKANCGHEANVTYLVERPPNYDKQEYICGECFGQ